MLRLLTTFVLVLFLGLHAFELKAQHETPSVETEKTDQKLFGQILKSGSFEFHLRSFYMTTINQGALTDYSTWGTGAGLGYFSPRWKGFGIGFSGFFVFRHFENNIIAKDPLTGKSNRYELLLYDVHHPENHKDMDRLEEFYLSFEKENISAWFGRHHFESPLLNASDNRMRPNLFSGLSVDWKVNNWKVSGAWFSHVISRGSLEWLPVEESFGFFDSGRHPLESVKEYDQEVDSKGIGVLGVEYEGRTWSVESWNYLSENVFGLTMLQLNGKSPSHHGWNWIWGVQAFYQESINDGGNPDPDLTYILPNENSSGFGARAGMNWPNTSVSINYLGISNSGRFLFPREWGREQFFVTLQRERFEGLGGANAVMLQLDQEVVKDKFKMSFGASHVKTPGIDNLALNKYGIPNYIHFTGLLDYKFDGFFQGLDLQFLVALKKENSEKEIPLEYVINRINMANLNLILDYRF